MRQNKQIQPILLIELLSSFSPHVHAEFELFPLDQKSDYRLHMTVAPIRAIYDAVSSREYNIRISFSLFYSQHSIELLSVLKQMVTLSGVHIQSLFFHDRKNYFNDYFI